MTTTITQDQVRHVAKLSRLKLNDQQVQQFSAQMANILTYVEKLNELDTSKVEPTAHAVPIKNILREDVFTDGMGIEKVLQNAPESDGPFFKVPRVLED